jgi:hypothetical protein
MHQYYILKIKEINEDKIEIDMGNETSEQRFHYPYYNQFF